MSLHLREYVIGVDEAGRGALAGPVCAGAVLMPVDFLWQECFALITKRGQPKLRDSKKLSPQQREILYSFITTHGALKHAFAFVDAQTIDTIGIVNATCEAAAQAVIALGISPSRVCVELDAGLKLSGEWRQTAHIRGDENIPAIAFASIVAKVSRDQAMVDLHSVYPEFDFLAHKGYGTQSHYRALALSGPSDIHRRTFLSTLYND